MVGWVSGTGLRPILQALPSDVRETFLSEYADRMRMAYPSIDGPDGDVTLLPFRRLFVVAHKHDGEVV